MKTQIAVACHTLLRSCRCFVDSLLVVLSRETYTLSVSHEVRFLVRYIASSYRSGVYLWVLECQGRNEEGRLSCFANAGSKSSILAHSRAVSWGWRQNYNYVNGFLALVGAVLFVYRTRIEWFSLKSLYQGTHNESCLCVTLTHAVISVYDSDKNLTLLPVN